MNIDDFKLPEGHWLTELMLSEPTADDIEAAFKERLPHIEGRVTEPRES